MLILFIFLDSRQNRFYICLGSGEFCGLDISLLIVFVFIFGFGIFEVFIYVRRGEVRFWLFIQIVYLVLSVLCFGFVFFVCGSEFISGRRWEWVGCSILVFYLLMIFVRFWIRYWSWIFFFLYLVLFEGVCEWGGRLGRGFRVGVVRQEEWEVDNWSLVKVIKFYCFQFLLRFWFWQGRYKLLKF